MLFDLQFIQTYNQQQPLMKTQIYKKPSKSSLNSEDNSHSNTFKTDSNKDLLGESQINQNFSLQYCCSFCKLKPIILQQLSRLKEAVIAKNQKIKQLECFIEKISKMAFNSSTEASEGFNQVLRSRDRGQGSTAQDMTFANYQRGLTSKQTQQNQELNNVESKSSLVRSQISQGEREAIKNSIKREVKKMNMSSDKQKNFDSSKMPKQSSLRTKLIEIMNILPRGSNQSKFQSFQTESEPLNEGIVGLVNSKVSNHKIVKQTGFIKKGEGEKQIILLNNNEKSDFLKRNHEKQYYNS